MGKKAGSLSRFKCVACGEVELVRGGNVGFLCERCKPASHITRSPQYIAHKAVADAKRSGAIRPASDFSCVDCGDPATGYDHRDYGKPLEIQPVCRKCNFARGPALSNKQPVEPAHVG